MPSILAQNIVFGIKISKNTLLPCPIIELKYEKLHS